MGDSATWGYMKGFAVWREEDDAKRNEELLDFLDSIGERIQREPEEMAELDTLLPGFLAEFKKLPHWDLIWGHGEVSYCSMGDQRGGSVGWHWKTQGSWKGYNPKPKDLAALKRLLLKYGYKVGASIPDGIFAYEG